MRTLSFLLTLGLAAGGCSLDVDGREVGGPCIDTLDCAAGSFCQRRSSYPGGMCTRNCEQDGDCGGGAVCVDIGGGTCALACEADADCVRDGYVCGEERRYEVPEQIGICRGS